MAHNVELPALDGREPLGFLAALGLLRLLTEEAAVDARLSFSSRTAVAVLSSEYADVDEVASALVRIATAADTPIPGVPTEFPTKAGRNADPMRVPQTQFRSLYERTRTTVERRWLSVLLTDLATDDKRRAALTPYNAPSGKMNLRTFFEKPATAVRAEPNLLLEALVGWRRVDGFTGEYLDHRVLRSGADDPLGRTGQEAGVPGATWLALMALPLLRLTGHGRNVDATCWYRIRGRREPIMVWPLWRLPLDLPSVQVAIEHPAVRPKLEPEGGRVVVDNRSLGALGIFTVCAAERQRVRERKFAGVLAPADISIREERRAVR